MMQQPTGFTKMARFPKYKYYANIEDEVVFYRLIPMNTFFAMGNPSIHIADITIKGNAYVIQNNRLYPLRNIDTNEFICRPEHAGKIRYQILKWKE